MNLDDVKGCASVDASGMLAHIDSLADQLEQGWQLGQGLALPALPYGINLVVAVGMGGSAYAVNLAVSAVAPDCRIPILVYRGYDLPTFARGPRVLVIASSYSGDTEETLSALAQAVERGCQAMVLTTGGELVSYAKAHGLVAWVFAFDGQPRAALGWTLGLLLALFERLSFSKGVGQQVAAASTALHKRQADYAPEVPEGRNTAKQFAQAFFGRIAVIYGAEPLDWVALRWRNQILENAKAWAQSDTLPELNHNAIAGTLHPGDLGQRLSVVVLAADGHYHPRVTARVELTMSLYNQMGIPCRVTEFKAESRLAAMLLAVQLGDYVSYYLALLYREDPTPIPPIAQFKEQLKAQITALSAV